MSNDFTERLQRSVRSNMNDAVARISSNVANRTASTITDLTNNVINKSVTGVKNTISSLFTSDTAKTSAEVAQNQVAPSVKATTVGQLPAGLGSKVTNATNMAGSIAESALSEVQGASSRILSSVAQTTSSAISDTIKNSLSFSSKGSSSPISSLGSKLASNISKQAQNAANNLVSSAGKQVNNMISGAISGVTDSVSSSLNSMFGSLSSSVSSLMNKVPASEKGSAEVNSKVTALAADSSEALSKPVAFVQKALKDTVTGATTAFGNTIAASLKELPAEALDKLNAAAGCVLDSVAEVNKFIDESAAALAEFFGGNVSDREILTSSGSGSVVPTGKTDNSTKGAVSTINKSYGSFFSSLVSTEGFNEANAASLNDVQLGYLSSHDTAYVDEVVSNAAKSYQQESSNLQDKLSYLSSDEVQTIHSSLGSSSIYPALSDAFGKDLSDTYGDTDLDTAQQMYWTANSLFPHITAPAAGTVVSRKDDKVVYDSLMTAAAKRRMADLTQQLKTEGQANGMYDNRTRQMLAQDQKESAQRGKVRNLVASMEVSGAASVSNPKQVLVKVAANMKPTSANITAFKTAATKLNETPDSVFQTEVGGFKVYNSSLTTIAAANGNETLDQLIGSDKRKMIESAKLLYNLS